MPIPSYRDPEGGSVIASLSEPTVPSGVTKAGVTLTNPNLLAISPVGFTEIGTHTIKIILADSCGNSLTNDLTIIVTNTAPYFTVPTLPEFKA